MLGSASRAEPSPTNNSSPPRVRIPQNRGKPLLVVADPTGTPLIDGQIFLAWQKTDGRFFIGRTKPRVYLGRDYDAARYRYREFGRGKEEDPTVAGQIMKTLAIVGAHGRQPRPAV